MDKTRAQEQLLTNWVAIILAVLSIIQGLAFNNLVIQFPDIYQYSRSSGDMKVLIHFFLSFVLLLRIFQTYLTAALDYNPWLPNFFDVLVIFVVGALEYFLFSTLKGLALFDIAQYHSRLTLISILGILGYLGALIRIREDLFPRYRDYAREVRLQVINIIGVAVVLSISVLLFVFPTMRAGTQLIFVSISMLTLTFNLLFSLRTTFSARTEEITTVSASKVSLPGTRADNKKIEVFFKIADREDVAEFVQVFVEHFGYFYSAIFDTSNRLTQKLLKAIFVLNRGKHPLGYKKFYLACEQTGGRIVGFFMVATKKTDGKINAIFGSLGSIMIVLFQLGIIGLIRAFRNLRKMGILASALERNEMRIVYFAVSPKCQRHGIGKQMFAFVESMARNLNKRSITLEVREANTDAQQFFRSMGFVEDIAIKSEGDALLNQGQRIRMAAVVS